MKVNHLSAMLLQPVLPDSLWELRGDNPSHPNQSLLLQGWWCGTPARSPDSLSWMLNVSPSPSILQWLHTLVVLALVPQPSGCARGQEQLLVSSHTGQSCEGAGTPALWEVMGDLGPKHRGVESERVKKRQEAERGLLNCLIKLRKHVQMNYLFVPVCRGSAVIYCQCHTQHMGAGLTQSCGWSQDRPIFLTAEDLFHFLGWSHYWETGDL